MDIWITTCRKTVPACSHCKEPIKLGEAMVVGKSWFRSSQEGGEVKRWVKNFRWHAQKQPNNQCCWLMAGLEYLAAHPYVETRGRSRLQLPQEQRDARLKLLRQRARLVQNLKELMEAPLDDKDMDSMIRIGSKIEELKEKIKPLGGVPQSWE